MMTPKFVSLVHHFFSVTECVSSNLITFMFTLKTFQTKHFIFTQSHFTQAISLSMFCFLFPWLAYCPLGYPSSSSDIIFLPLSTSIQNPIESAPQTQLQSTHSFTYIYVDLDFNFSLPTGFFSDSGLVTLGFTVQTICGSHSENSWTLLGKKILSLFSLTST